MTTLVELKNVSKVIKGKRIIDSLSFTIQAGEVFGFLGPNGAGKTTTIRMIVGLMKLSEGDIVICGHSIQKNFEKAVSNIGAIVENPEMYKFLTGYQNLQQYARMQKGITKERIAEVVQLVGLGDRIHDKVKTYSLGMRQRLGIAQSLLHSPKVLILDEPTNGLDPAGIKEIRQYIRDLAEKEKMAVIVSSHLLSEMEMMCDRIGIIQKGRLIHVQSVRDWVDDGREVYSIEVDHVDTAAKLMTASFPDIRVKIAGSSLSVEAGKEQIPDIISLLVSKNMRVYEVKQLSKTLEEKFLEITEKQEAVS
ncbi:ABC transporter ATP-binding protein [Bacillus badius]|uniref:ABC transporter, ATP-binding protein n=1 Tax=Bacillus badius TaxID=1455 RepID=A0ABR5AUG5_BACBA|nr:ABC transporter ATP-binding protein [Bacillus badius]KIL78016.1 ABC transporter, ATP-binding protein [Bacillus badius]KZN98733.1 bacitracin ABC transporter ATP-binding protein [Bacillus badius]KZR58423.1 bacitracin ABC transporter ATP-binding protein [Bacillus badius]MED0666278.1 ABC transporter ATP-binding protein [Bacillus badius]MED4716443.1 ABC transporter ATP-binding protein [Bacillus badius]